MTRGRRRSVLSANSSASTRDGRFSWCGGRAGGAAGTGTVEEVSRINDPLGNVTHLAWTSYTRDDGKVVPLLASVTNARGNLVYSNQYDGCGCVIKQT